MSNYHNFGTLKDGSLLINVVKHQRLVLSTETSSNTLTFVKKLKFFKDWTIRFFKNVNSMWQKHFLKEYMDRLSMSALATATRKSFKEQIYCKN